MSVERKPWLHPSALSPCEYVVFPKWLDSLKPARSGAAECVEEADALRFLREECDVGVEEEIKMLSLFERFPLGLPAGVFFALLRLASHAQRGQEITLEAVFTQATPPRTVTAAAAPLPPPPKRLGSASVTASSPEKPKGAPPQVPAKPDKQQLEVAADSNPFHHTTTGILDAAPNPFIKQSGMIKSTKVIKAVNGTATAANPFRSTPPPPRRSSTNDEVVTPSHSPVQRAESARSSAPSTADLHSPPLPPRPLLGERPPPPLPPRAINPLIQAGLAARSQVRKKKEALPPKTYSVIQSSSAPVIKQPSEPRLLDGKPPPPGAPIPVPVTAATVVAPSTISSTAGAVVQQPPPPQHHAAKRKPTGSYDARRSVSDMAMLRGGGGQDVEMPLPAHRVVPLKAPRAVSAGLLRPTATRVTPTFAPKASYGAVKQIDGGPSSTTIKGGLPSWLREQEELQRSSLIDTTTGVSSRTTHSHTLQHRLSHLSIDTPPSVASSRITFLDDEEDEDDISSEHASVAASIDRNNPFFLRSARDADAATLPPNAPTEQLTKLAVARAAAVAAKRERDEETTSRLAGAWVRASSDGEASTSGLGVDGQRPLGRSKTLRGTPGVPPAPPRRKLEVGPAQLDSGTYAGFGKPARVEGPQGGGLRLVPSSKKAEVGLPPHVVLERQRERAARERGALHQNPPPPPPPPVRRASANSALSAASSATLGNAPVSPGEGQSPFTPKPASASAAAPVPVQPLRASTAVGLRERVSGLLGLAEAPPKGSRPIDALKADLTSVAERHEWLARAAERVKGQPLSEATTRLMQDAKAQQQQQQQQREDNDAPHTDEAYYEERRRERDQEETHDEAPLSQSPVSLSRRSTTGAVAGGHGLGGGSGGGGARSSSAGLRRASSSAARRSVAAMEGPFSDLSREAYEVEASSSSTHKARTPSTSSQTQTSSSHADDPKPDDAEHQAKGWALLA